jgi:hypothetical protein
MSNDSIKVEQATNPLFEIAFGMEGAASHLTAMIKIATEKCEGISSALSPTEIAQEKNAVLAVLDAAKTYVFEIQRAKNRIYEEAWTKRDLH